MSGLPSILLSAAAGCLFSLLVILLARRGRISMRYTLGWLFVALCVIVGGVFSGLVTPVADTLGVAPQAVLFGVAVAGLLGLTVQLSITVSGLTEIVRTLAESHALLEARVREAAIREPEDNVFEKSELT